MGARDRYTSAVICPGCGQTGVLYISEDEYRYSPMRREIDKIEGEFFASLEKNKITLTCGQCRRTWIK